MPHHRYINLSLGLEPEGGKLGGERDKPATPQEKTRALTTLKRRFEGLKFDGYVIAEISDPAVKSTA